VRTEFLYCLTKVQLQLLFHISL